MAIFTKYEYINFKFDCTLSLQSTEPFAVEIMIVH